MLLKGRNSGEGSSVLMKVNAPILSDIKSKGKGDGGLSMRNPGGLVLVPTKSHNGNMARRTTGGTV